MNGTNEKLTAFRKEAEKLHHRLELSKTVGPDYFEPGMMEYLDQSEGVFDEMTGEFLLRFEARGTRYDGRTEMIEMVREGDPIVILREKDNPFNANNFTMETARGKNVGNMPADLCNAIAPLYDNGELEFTEVKASFVEPITKRNRHAKQAVLFVEARGKILRRSIE